MLLVLLVAVTEVPGEVLEQPSAAQPSARGHFFARQKFLECPQDLLKKFFLIENALLTLLYEAILVEKKFKSKTCPRRLFASNICPIDKKVGHRCTRVMRQSDLV